MHEPVRLPCIFGCSEPDSLLHYLCCTKLRALAVAALKLPGPVQTRSVLLSLAVSPSKLLQIYILYVSFTLYHICKKYLLNDVSVDHQACPLILSQAQQQHFTAVAAAVARKLETITGVSCFTLRASAPPFAAEEIASETWEQFFAGAGEM